ncbi:MAG: type II toxin-antitoxin system VapC family toxin [Polyangia bacterium]
MVVDTSALLALLFDEPSAPWVARKMNERIEELEMSPGCAVTIAPSCRSVA